MLLACDDGLVLDCKDHPGSTEIDGRDLGDTTVLSSFEDGSVFVHGRGKAQKTGLGVGSHLGSQRIGSGADGAVDGAGADQENGH